MEPLGNAACIGTKPNRSEGDSGASAGNYPKRFNFGDRSVRSDRHWTNVRTRNAAEDGPRDAGLHGATLAQGPNKKTPWRSAWSCQC